MAQQRELFRIAVDRTGWLHRGLETARCQVVNMTEKGFRLRVQGSFAPGESLHLTLALQKHDLLACTVRVIYAHPPFLGAGITHISPAHQASLSCFIDQVNILHLTGTVINVL